MSQQQERKFYPCRRGCGIQVTFDNRFRNQDGSKMVPLETDVIGQLIKHNCPNWEPAQQQQRQQQPQTTQQQQPQQSDVAKEIGAIKAQLLVLVGRLDRLEQEVQR